MTIGGWILFGFIVISICAASLSLGIMIAEYHCSTDKGEKIAVVVSVVVGVVISVLVLIGMHAYYNNTESGKRAMKTQESNLKGGISRSVSVYDINGGLIAEYSGKFDVDYNSSRIIFDDENGRRHIIYYTTATVIIDETGGTDNE
ncbi:MAG: hypothetical protein IJ874_09265 [Ruminococcus sp.]|nr:hypothetical protein [Ruminococcus sp.]